MNSYTIMGSALVLVLNILSSPVELNAQTSVGYGDPDDISNLLDYRLPDWSYRTWDLGFELDGSNSDSRAGGSASESDRFSFNLGTDYLQTWESEQRFFNVQASASGDYSGSHRMVGRSESYELDQDALFGRYNFSFEVNQYLGDGPFSLQASGSTNRQYEGIEETSSNGSYNQERSQFIRTSSHWVSLGLGWGRLRNVVPLLRAQRLSERLVAMGRPGLNPRQVQEVARVMATEYSYRKVFDRSDRHFWSEVLAPVLDPENPLSPFEVFYLTDVLNEDLGDRKQGFEIVLGGNYSEGHYENTFIDSDSNSRRRSTSLNFNYFQNLSLTQQLSIMAEVYYYWINVNESEEDDGHFALTVAHLWNFADRYNLSTSLSYSGNMAIPEEFGRHYVWLDSTFRVYLEDRVSLTTEVSCLYRWNDYEGQESFGWDLGYRLGLEYHLDRLLF